MKKNKKSFLKKWKWSIVIVVALGLAAWGIVFQRPKQNADLTIAINSGFLEQSLIKKNGSYMLQPREEMPF